MKKKRPEKKGGLRNAHLAIIPLGGDGLLGGGVGEGIRDAAGILNVEGGTSPSKKTSSWETVKVLQDWVIIFGKPGIEY